MKINQFLNYLAYSHAVPPDRNITPKRWAAMIKHIIVNTNHYAVDVQSLFDMKGNSNVPMQQMQRGTGEA